MIVKRNNEEGYFTFVLKGNEKNRRKELRNLFLNVISADVCTILNSILSERQKLAIGIASSVIQETLLSKDGVKIPCYAGFEFLKNIQSIELLWFCLWMFPWICVSSRKLGSVVLSLEPGVVPAETAWDYQFPCLTSLL